jgi:hypothetical protein
MNLESELEVMIYKSDDGGMIGNSLAMDVLQYAPVVRYRA